MKKLLGAVLVAGALVYAILWLIEGLNRIDADVNNVRETRDRARTAAANDTPEKGKTAPPSSSSTAPTPSTPSTPPSVSSGTEFVCSKDIDAYKPSKPTERVGKFLKGSKLKIGPVDPVSGMYRVQYQPPVGKEIQALCRRGDIER